MKEPNAGSECSDIEQVKCINQQSCGTVFCFLCGKETKQSIIIERSSANRITERQVDISCIGSALLPEILRHT